MVKLQNSIKEKGQNYGSWKAQEDQIATGNLINEKNIGP